MKIKYKYIAISGYLYALIPIIIFFIGWLKIYFSIPLSLILIIGFINMIKKDYSHNTKEIIISSKGCILLLFTLLIWIYISGPGGFFFETWDFHTKNAIFRDLIDFKWPVIYPNTNNALVYYFTQWMIPSLFGKIFGLSIAKLMLAIITYIGILIVFLLLAFHVNAKTTKQLIVVCAILITWGGLNNWGAMTTSIIGKGNYLMGNSDGWMDIINGYQYSSNDTLLSWVFNQTIVPWIMTILALDNKKIRNFAFIGLCIFPFGPFPFVGLALILISMFAYECIKNIRSKEMIIDIFKQIFSMPNICAIISIFIPFTLFFKCNVVAGFLQFYIPINEFELVNVVYLLYFAFIEYMVYSIFIINKYKKNYLFYTINILLLMFPLFSIGPSRDFLMRASIPELFCMMIFVIEYLIDSYEKNINKVQIIVLIILLAISANNFVGEFSQRLMTIQTKKQFPIVADDTKTLSNMNLGDDNPNTFEENYLVPNPEETIFFKYIAKNKK